MGQNGTAILRRPRPILHGFRNGIHRGARARRYGRDPKKTRRIKEVRDRGRRETCHHRDAALFQAVQNRRLRHSVFEFGIASQQPVVNLLSYLLFSVPYLGR